MSRARALALSLAALTIAHSATAAAPPVPIRMARGQSCWRYAGSAFAFAGSFQAGQRITVTATGDEHNGDGRHEWVTTKPRDVSVSAGPGDRLVYDSSEARDDSFRAPRTGRYTFTLWPHAIQGYPGTVIVCAW